MAWRWCMCSSFCSLGANLHSALLVRVVGVVVCMNACMYHVCIYVDIYVVKCTVEQDVVDKDNPKQKPKCSWLSELGYGQADFLLCQMGCQGPKKHLLTPNSGLACPQKSWSFRRLQLFDNKNEHWSFAETNLSELMAIWICVCGLLELSSCAKMTYPLQQERYKHYPPPLPFLRFPPPPPRRGKLTPFVHLKFVPLMNFTEIFIENFRNTNIPSQANVQKSLTYYFY